MLYTGLIISLISGVSMSEPEYPTLSTLRVVRKGKELVQQLKQTTDKATRLQDELRQASETERQLQMQLYDLQEEFKPDKEMNHHGSMEQFYVSTMFQKKRTPSDLLMLMQILTNFKVFHYYQENYISSNVFRITFFCCYVTY